MKLVSNLAVAAALAVAGTALVGTAPAFAKEKAPEAPKVTYSDAERKALAPVQAAITKKDWEGAKAVLGAAQAASVGPDAKYALGQFELQIGLGTSDTAMQAQAIDDMLVSGRVPAAQLPTFYRNQGALASQAKNLPKAETAFAKVLELTPDDPEAMMNLAKAKIDLNKNAEAFALLERSISAQEAAGKKPDENLYRYTLKLAYESKNMAESQKIAAALMKAYPSPANWQSALVIYRNANAMDKSTELDLLRLMRASKALTQGGEYLELAQQLDTSGLPGEAKSVLEEGVAAGKITTANPGYVELMRTIGPRSAGDKATLPSEEGRANAAATGTLALRLADAYASYGNYPKAVSLYQAALGKGGVDANVVNMRLGIALAQSGDKAGAAAAFQKVTGSRAGLAALWLSWISRGA